MPVKIKIPKIKTVLNDIKDLTIGTFKKAIEDDIITQGAAIAFYTIFSITPLFILIVTLSGFFLSEEIIEVNIQNYVADLAGDTIAENLNLFLEGADFNYSAGVITTIIASITVIFGATTVISQLKSTLNRIWNVRTVEMNSIWHFLLTRVLSFGMIILVSVLLILSLMAEAIIGFVSAFLMDILPFLDVDFFKFVSELTTIAFAVCFFTLIFKILPDVHAPWSYIWIGAFVTTALFLLGKYLIGLYLSASGIEVAYRAAGSLIVFIIWVYYNIQTILLGAVFTQVYTEKFGGKILPYKFVLLKDNTNTNTKAQ